jgi:SAM-dependent methyltransferase
MLDPDRNLWEVYALTADIAHRGSLAASDALAARDRAGHVAAWDHKLGDELPERLPLADGAVHEVRLRGTFNAPRGEEVRARLLAEVMRVLAPGGQVMIHGLACDKPLPGGFPRLPGPAALVKHTPLEHEPSDWLRAAGFAGVYLQKLGELPNFEHDQVKMREVMAVGWKPEPAEGERVVVYRGPFAEVVDDEGRRYVAGHRVTVGAETAARLSCGPLADQLVFLRDRSRESSP